MLNLYLFKVDDYKDSDLELPKHVHDHVERYTDRNAHDQSKAAWTCAYLLLSKYKFNWKNLEFKDDVPTITNSKIYFSISHSEKMFAIAVSDSIVGVDVQFLVPMHRCNALYPYVFRQCEHAYLNATNKQKTFTEAFTQYECAIKLAQTKFVPKTFNTFWIGDKYCLTTINLKNEVVDKVKTKF